jgi:hypothetical protein
MQGATGSSSAVGKGSARVTKLAAALILALICTACGSTAVSSGTGAHGGGLRVSGAGSTFAGELWENGDVTSVSASWRVPMIDPAAKPASKRTSSGASTWIGAQVSTPGAERRFIQIGTAEFLSPSGARSYTAFWSDEHRADHPQFLASVHPGDEMTASMHLADGRWRLAITDRTRDLHRQVRTPEEAAGAFNLALWLQEDVDSGADRPLPYPAVSRVRMSALRVDGAPPTPQDAESTWMSLPHEYLGPTPLTHDAFSVVPQRLSGAGARYLGVVDPLDAASNRFLEAISGWRMGTTDATATAEAHRFLAVLRRSVDCLRAGPWPAAVATPVRTLVGLYSGLIGPLARASTPRAVGSVVVNLYNFGQIDSEDQLIRQGVGVESAPY